MVRVERYATAGRAVTARGSAGRVPRRYLEPRAGRVPRRANGCAGPIGAHARPLLARKRSEVVIRAAPKTRKPRRNAVPKALCRTRTGDPFLTIPAFCAICGNCPYGQSVVLQDFWDSADWAVFADASQMRPTNTVSVTIIAFELSCLEEVGPGRDEQFVTTLSCTTAHGRELKVIKPLRDDVDGPERSTEIGVRNRFRIGRLEQFFACPAEPRSLSGPKRR